MRKIFSSIIKFYQLTVSPIFSSLGGGCRFYPSCSEYSKAAFRKHSWPKALLISFWRILRCNPFHPGGVEPVK